VEGQRKKLSPQAVADCYLPYLQQCWMQKMDAPTVQSAPSICQWIIEVFRLLIGCCFTCDWAQIWRDSRDDPNWQSNRIV